ncbi:MAG: FAD-dependent oxidoreductase [Pseudomonadota bacterium]
MSEIAKITDQEVPPWAAGAAQRMHELDPELTAEEIDTLRPYGVVKDYAEGEMLFHAGEPSQFIIALEGGIDILHKTDEGERVIISHGPGHYLGETVSMSGGRALISARAREPLKALVIDADGTRQIIATEPDLGEKILLSFILRRMRMVAERLANVTVIGDFRRSDTTSLQSFLSRNGIPFETADSEKEPVRVSELLSRRGLSVTDLPAVVCNENVLVQPSNRELAECLGFTVDIDCGVTYDLAVVGSGPAGMTAAVYAASEGLSVVVLEACAPGGQAASSSKIENYMGFPTGITGQALMGRAYLQAQKFGAQIAMARELQSFECGEGLHKLRIDGNDLIYAKSVVIASGAIYRQPQLDGLDRLGGIHYAASHVEGELCRGRDVAVVGGGNSAGQAAMYLSKRARHVHILIRGKDLSHSMSSYLIDRIEKTENITLHSYTEIQRLNGEDHLKSLIVTNNQSEAVQDLPVSHLFIFIGAQPGTKFLEGQIALDARGFVLTGDSIDLDAPTEHPWPLKRKPYLLETSCPRVFAAGDVRSGSVKRVASAVGEGSVCLQYIHRSLAELEDA